MWFKQVIALSVLVTISWAATLERPFGSIQEVNAERPTENYDIVVRALTPLKDSGDDDITGTIQRACPADAECTFGACCTSTCTFKPYGTTCRASTGECDIAEYCTGDSNACPTDEHVVDGTSCNNNGGYCYSGSCPTHDEQCGVAFGSDSLKGHRLCYNLGNVLGNRHGNCGSNNVNFITCTEENVECGQLQCTEGRLQYPFNFIFPTRVFNGQLFGRDGATGRRVVCRHFTTYPGENRQGLSPGLVKDGTKCGNGRVCIRQQCVTVAVTTTNRCGRGSNGQICSGNGVCNNRGRCSCNVGFTGSVCQSRNVARYDVSIQSLACPPVPPGSFGTCVNLCSDDDSCPEGQKCCSNGCGRVCRVTDVMYQPKWN